MTRREWVKQVCIIIFWLAMWQIASMAVKNSIILVGPVDVARSLILQVMETDFWRTIGLSFGKISVGFLSAFLSGILIGSVAYRFSFLRELLEPVIVLMKSIPVASFVILALIWIGSENLSVFISFTVVFPIIYISTIAGLRSTDFKLLEMASVFRMTNLKKIYYIYRPALLPYLISGCDAALGMSWKSGIAAEVIGVPSHSIGEKLYMAKIYLSTGDLFAWTLVIIVISVVFEKVFLKLLKITSGQYRNSRKRGM